MAMKKKHSLGGANANKAVVKPLFLTLEVAQFVRDARLEADLTQSSLAEKMGTSQGWIAQLESSQSKASLVCLAQVAAACGGELKLIYIPAGTNAPKEYALHADLAADEVEVE